MKRVLIVFLAFAMALSMAAIISYPACAAQAIDEVLYTKTSEGTFLKYEMVDYGHFFMIDSIGNTISFFLLRNVGVNIKSLEKGKSVRVTWQRVNKYLDPPGRYITIDELLSVKVLEAPKVILDGTELSFDVPPTIDNGRILVPLRTIFEALGAQVNWDGATQTIKATKGGITIVAKIGSTQATVNGATKTLDVPAQVINGRTLVPVRFISESLGAKVDWDEASQTVVISTVNNPRLPVDKTLETWYGLTYPGHDSFGAYQYSAIDIHLSGGSEADRGKNVYAIEEGKYNIGSDYVTLEHTKPLILKNGTVIKTWYSMYGHLEKNKDLIDGKTYPKGTILGTISDVCVTQKVLPHLHFVIYRNWDNSTSSAISPYWLPGEYSNGQFLYADDENGVRNDGGEPGLYDNRIFSKAPAE